MTTMTMTKLVAVMVLAGGCGFVDRSTGQTDQMVNGSGGGDAGTGSGSGSGGPVWHSSMKGGGASAYFSDGQTAGSIDAYESGAGNDRTVSLTFMIQGPDPASQVCDTWSDPWWGSYTNCYYTVFLFAQGWGTIPSSDLQIGANAASARLHTTTDSTFFIQTCRNGADGVGDCTYGATSESFDIAWNKNNLGGYEQDGTTLSTMGAFKFRTSGRLVQSSATPTGTAAGFVVAGGNGSIQTTNGVRVSRDIVAAP